MAVMVATVFAASLLGSLHCAGMCGGFVSFYAGADTSRGIRRSFSHLAYNGGRLVTYTVLGVLFGWLGKAVDRAGSMAGVGRLAYLAAAVLMIAWGVWSLLLALNLRIPSLPAPAFLARAGRRVFHSMEKKHPVARAALLAHATLLVRQQIPEGDALAGLDMGHLPHREPCGLLGREPAALAPGQATAALLEIPLDHAPALHPVLVDRPRDRELQGL